MPCRMSADSRRGPRHSVDLPWIDRWISANRDLAELGRSHPMTDAVIEAVDGRRIRIGDRWLADFASCNYLGFDLDPEIMAVVPEVIAKWGTHPSWSRLLGSPVLYEQIEERLTELLGCEDALVLPTITLIHMSVIPVLAGSGTIFLENRAHKTVYDGCVFARAHGATLRRFAFEDPADLERLLREPHPAPRLVCLDGINSMTGNPPDLPAFARIAREYDAVLYVDDAHGFGVIGERSPREPSPYGLRGDSIVRHFGESYENVVLVGGFSKADASLATVLAGFDVNDARGDAIRAGLWDKAVQVLDCLDRLGAHTPNRSGFPLVEVPLADHTEIAEVGRFLFDHGIYVTLAAYPLVPKSEVGFRIQITAANTQAEIDQLVDVLARLSQRFELQPARSTEVAA